MSETYADPGRYRDDDRHDELARDNDRRGETERQAALRRRHEAMSGRR